MGNLLRSEYAAQPRTLLDILDRTVEMYAEAPAIDDGNGPITYDELAIAVELVRSRLRKAGVGPGDRVGIRLPSGTADLYLGILGVLAAGAAYVPVDLDDPAERAELVFAEAGVAAVLARGMEIVPRRDGGSPPRPERPGPDDDAWIIFTSGSTGRPKGVSISHRAIVNQMLWRQDVYRLTEDDVLIQKTPATFDVSVLISISIHRSHTPSIAPAASRCIAP